jgi:Polycystin cation channel
VYYKISTINQFWFWLERSFLWNIRAQPWYNGDQPYHLNGFINDKTNRLIGWPIIRQIRIRSKSCSDQRIQSICEDDYHYSIEENRSYQQKWTNQTMSSANSSVDRAFQYRSSKDLDSYVYLGQYGSYSGGGYVFECRGSFVELEKHFMELHQSEWINQQTRAVIIQLNLYNPNVQLFTSIFLVLEFLSTGTVHPHIRIDPINFNGQ